MRNGALLTLGCLILAVAACHRAADRQVAERSVEQPGDWRSLRTLGEPTGLGISATAAQVGAASITVFPNGRGLPAGSGSVAEGQSIYAARCAACHGEQGEGQGDFPQLVGGRGTLASDKPVQTIGSFWPYSTTVFDYIRRAMPYNAPGSLSPSETYAVTAYLLHLNRVIPGNAVLSQRNLAAIKMPNRSGFVGDPRPDVKQ